MKTAIIRLILSGITFLFSIYTSADTIKYQFFCAESGTSTTPLFEVSPEGSWNWEIAPEKKGEGVYYSCYIGPNLGVQIGSKNSPYKEATFTHKPIENVAKIILETATTSKGFSEIQIFVGEEQMGETLSLDATKNNSAKVMSEYEFATESLLSGVIKVLYKRMGSNSNSQAIYLNSISIITTSTEGELPISSPIFSHKEGIYNGPLELSITSEDGDVFYSTDNTDPKNGILYSSPIILSEGTTTIRAITHKDGYYSDESVATYTIVENNDIQNDEFILANIEDLEKGGSFYMASALDISSAWVATNFSGNKLVSTNTRDLFNTIDITPNGDYYTLQIQSKKIGVINIDGTDLTTSNNYDWTIQSGENNGQFIISNKLNNQEKPRALLFDINNGGVKYYRSSDLRGYSNYVYLFKKVNISKAKEITNHPEQLYRIYNTKGELILSTNRLYEAKQLLKNDIYIVNGKKIYFN